MPRKEKERTLAELESNQAELRRNIETSKELIEKSDRLLDRYRVAHEEAPAETADAAEASALKN